MTIYTEITPNPATLKFVANKVLLPVGSADFPDQDSAAESPLAMKLFEMSFVTGVFIGYNFVSVTKEQASTWEEIIPLVKNTLKTFLESGEPLLNNMEEPVPTGDPSDEDPIIRRIKQLLEENIRPAVAMDGGDVVFESFEEGKVKLRLQGACSGCPSSTMTLKMGIEGLLTRMVPEVKEVEAVS